MHATVRRYEGVDAGRTDELTKKVGETLIPSLSRLPGFSGYYLIEAGNGVMTSVSFFDTSSQADESTRVASNWVQNGPEITAVKSRIRNPTSGPSAIGILSAGSNHRIIVATPRGVIARKSWETTIRQSDISRSSARCHTAHGIASSSS